VAIDAQGIARGIAVVVPRALEESIVVVVAYHIPAGQVGDRGSVAGSRGTRVGVEVLVPRQCTNGTTGGTERNCAGVGGVVDAADGTHTDGIGRVGVQIGENIGGVVYLVDKRTIEIQGPAALSVTGVPADSGIARGDVGGRKVGGREADVAARSIGESHLGKEGLSIAGTCGGASRGAVNIASSSMALDSTVEIAMGTARTGCCIHDADKEVASTVGVGVGQRDFPASVHHGTGASPSSLGGGRHLPWHGRIKSGVAYFGNPQFQIRSPAFVIVGVEGQTGNGATSHRIQ